MSDSLILFLRSSVKINTNNIDNINITHNIGEIVEKISNIDNFTFIKNNIINHMYFDTNTYIGNIGTETYLHFDYIGRKIFVKILDTTGTREKLIMKCEHNITLELDRGFNHYNFALCYYNNTYYNNIVDRQFIKNYPYNNTMTRNMITIEYYSIKNMYDNDKIMSAFICK